MTHNGIQPVNIRQHLRPIADLIELCFAQNMDASGRAMIQEMRMLSNSGPLLWMMHNVDTLLKGLMQGYIWLEDGQVIGNVSIYPAGYGQTWVIGNVAVHPDHRGKGIAQALCQAALERITHWRGKAAILQVDHNNASAIHIYDRLGFRAERTFTHWYWSSYRTAPKMLPEMPRITYRALHEWRAEYRLAQQVRPQEYGGIGWLKPTREADFRLTPWRLLSGFFAFSANEHWVVRGKNDLQAALLTRSAFGSSTLYFDLMIHPDHQASLTAPLLNHVLRRAYEQFKNAATEHPSDDLAASEAFLAHEFQARRQLIHMRRELS